jgi:hypothetical protein
MILPSKILLNPISSLDGPVAIISNDAGSTNLLLGWIRNEIHIHAKVMMEGPAKSLWQSSFPERELVHSLDELLQGVSTLISGTGWASNIEQIAREIASANGIKNVAVIDHWVNYRSRFERNGKIQLPDEVWVSDTYAFNLACQSLPRTQIHLLENQYLTEQLKRIAQPPGNGTVLFVLEPVRSTWGRTQEGEFQALNYFFNQLHRLSPSGISKVILRPHPSESQDKYLNWLTHHRNVEFDMSTDIAAAISLADVVVGVESYALTVALAAGRPVYSSLPPWAPPLRLPHTDIQQIRYLDSK